jgi:N-methylhydantoinase A
LTRAAIDIGGTFTDAVAVDEHGAWRIAKVRTTPSKPSKGFMTALASVAAPEAITTLIHGTTVVLNALLTQQFPRTALVTTAGFRDVLEIMRGDRKDLFDIYQTKPSPLVPRRWRLEIDERIAATGEIVVPLDDTKIALLLDEINAIRPDAIAVCLLFSFKNPLHEREVGEAIGRRFPDIPLSLSHEILPVYREFERTSTTVVNALARPLMDNYLREANATLLERGFVGDFLVMQSTGGVIEHGDAARRPVETLFSGPAGGVICAQRVAEWVGIENVINVDMGGTSCDVSAVSAREPDRSDGFEIGGFPVAVPSIDIASVGAGGGSIAWVDDGGGAHVGPQSAGAAPGPACYGQGGTRPTVTDASVVLGRYNPAAALGGELRVDRKLAATSFTDFRTRLGLSLEAAAWAVLRIVTTNMASALREVSVERGRDPRNYVLLASGGAGPGHGVDIADEVGVSFVVIPPYPGAGSAHGMLLADVRKEALKTVYCPLGSINDEELHELLLALGSDAGSELSATQSGDWHATPELHFGVDLRYQGQSYHLTVPVDPSQTTVSKLQSVFHRTHEARYGHSFPSAAVELINLRAAIVRRQSQVELRPPEWPKFPPTARPVFWGPEHGWLTTDVVSRTDAQSHGRLEGPLIVEEHDSTIIVPPGVHLWSLRGGCLALSRDVGRAQKLLANRAA